MSSATFSTGRKILSTPVLIALVTLRGYQDFKKGEPVYIEDLAQHLAHLKANGVNTSRISLSRSLDKYWSDDVAQFVSEGLVFGFLTHNSPITFDKRCVEVCKNAIEVANNEGLQEVVDQASKALKLESIDALLNAA